MIIPPVSRFFPANEVFMETAGIEPAICYARGAAVETYRMQGNCPRDAWNVRGRDTEGVASMQPQPIPVPLRDRTGTIVGFAVLDVADAQLASERWYLDSDPRREMGKLYARRNGERDGKRFAVYLHREVLGLEPGDRRQGDHINGLTLDCRRANLRIVTNAENAQNRRIRAASSSQHRGVTWDKSRGKWLAQATLNGKCHHLGRFDSEQEAAEVAAAFRAEHMPYSQEAA